MKFIGIIPARYASTRFPGKALVEIDGKSMIQRVYEQAKKARSLSDLVVATDDQRIEKHVTNFGGTAIMTSDKHQSGTDRCNEAIETLLKQTPGQQYDVVINIQGDEPFVDPEQIENLTIPFNNGNVKIATLIKKIVDKKDLFNVNVVKAIINKNKEAIYFSRTPIPYLRGEDKSKWTESFTFYKHIGIYAYRVDVLKQITRLAPSKLELAESLEQLRWIENGINISVEYTNIESYGIDTPEDISRLSY